MIFSTEGLSSAKTALVRLKRLCSEIKDDQKINKEYLEEFTKTINDDLNMPEAEQVLWKLLGDENAEGKFETIKKIDEVLGLDLLKKKSKKSLKKF
jgi:cysteinyl-tRNA synthetase